ncbi:MAG: NAD(P)-dependent oxidoreductase [Pseudomonadota bacterium]
MSFNVAILEPLAPDTAVERSILEPLGGRVVTVGATSSAIAAVAAINPQALFVRRQRVGAPLLEAAGALKVVACYGEDISNIDLASATRNKVAVVSVPEYGAEHEKSDHVLALYLALQRRIVPRDRHTRAGRRSERYADPIPGRLGAVLGLVGCGPAGLEAARKFAALGFARTICADPTIDDETLAHHSIARTDITTLCQTADVVMLDLPIDKKPLHVIDAAYLALMKSTTILINVCRGDCVDEPALADALNRYALFGAGLDVFSSEPPSRDNPLLTAPNTILSDNTSRYSQRTIEILRTHAAEDVAKVISGRTPNHWANPWT